MATPEVWIGGAHIDERGQAHGGAAGDQTGKELSIRKYYRHKLGWRVFRAPATHLRQRIAEAMIAACENPCIGYDQYQRESLYKAAAIHGFNPALVDTPCETDCSALVRVCCAYAGYRLPEIRTWSEPAALLAAGFTEITCRVSNLQVGDILCTPSAGHTEIVVRVEGGTNQEEEMPKMDILAVGAKGHQVKVLQVLLRMCGYVLDVDGVFGARTSAALKQYQRSRELEVDGICGPLTWARLLKG